MADPRPSRRRIVTVHAGNGDGAHARKQYDSAPREAEEAERIVVDDWPEDVPITSSEVDVLEAFLGDMLDAFLRPR
jgi:hypothetical protein